MPILLIGVVWAGHWALAQSHPYAWFGVASVLSLALGIGLARRLLRPVPVAGTFIAIGPRGLVICLGGGQLEQHPLDRLGIATCDTGNRRTQMVLEIDGQPRHIPVRSVFRFHPSEAEACVRFVNAIRRAGMIIPSQQVIHRL
jgi:hypothetical protein